MNVERKPYTFTFDAADEGRFRQIMGRLDPDEFVVLEDIHRVETGREYERKMATTIEMEPEAASTFRFGMKDLKIQRPRTEEEIANEKAYEERNKITITVHTGTPTP